MKKIFLAMTLLLLTNVALATPVKWTLQDWVFDDGGTASGSFVFDASTSIYSDISVTTTDGSVRTGASYDTRNPSSPGFNLFASWVTGTLADLTGTPVIGVDWAVPLTDLGGSVFVDVSGDFFYGEYSCSDAVCGGPTSTSSRNLIRGAYVTTNAVPVPATFLLFGLGLAGIGFARKKMQF